MEYILEYNPIQGFFHHNSGSAATNTFNWHQISEKMPDTHFGLFQELMTEKYGISPDNKNNPKPEIIKQEFEYFSKVVDGIYEDIRRLKE